MTTSQYSVSATIHSGSTSKPKVTQINRDVVGVNQEGVYQQVLRQVRDVGGWLVRLMITPKQAPKPTLFPGLPRVDVSRPTVGVPLFDKTGDK